MSIQRTEELKRNQAYERWAQSVSTAPGKIYSWLSNPGTGMGYAAEKTKEFVRDNWTYIIGVAILAVLVTFGPAYILDPSLGATFQLNYTHTAIGLGCGLAIGLITGVFPWAKLYEKYEKQHSWHEYLTIAGIFYTLTNNLGDFGRGLIISIAVYVFLAFTARMPAAMGAAAGIVLGNYLAVTIYFYEGTKTRLQRIQSLEDQLKVLEKMMAQIRESVKRLAKVDAEEEAPVRQDWRKSVKMASNEAAQALAQILSPRRKSGPTD